MQIAAAVHPDLMFVVSELGLENLQARPRFAVETNDNQPLVIGGGFRVWAPVTGTSLEFELIAMHGGNDIYVHTGLKSDNVIVVATSSILQGSRLYVSTDDATEGRLHVLEAKLQYERLFERARAKAEASR